MEKRPVVSLVVTKRILESLLLMSEMVEKARGFLCAWLKMLPDMVDCWALRVREKKMNRTTEIKFRINRVLYQSYFDTPADTVKQDGIKVNNG
jgi:hypothetical protein